MLFKGVDYNTDDAEVHVDETFSEHSTSFEDADLVLFGFMTAEEAELAARDRAEYERQRQDRWDRATYERLKAKFEPAA
jgi:hypothetical protein